MLRGNYPATVDAKGRVKIPTAFKPYLEATFGHDFYATSFDGQSVRVYPFSVWREIEEKLATLPSMNKSKRKFLDRVNYWGQAVQMDAQGRILIPSLLRESGGMQGEVAVIGYLNYLDVWNMDRFRQNLDSNPLTDDDMQALSDLGI
jgi:transcriptional regulator MraZ